MEKFKSVLFSILIFAISMLAVFWAFSTIESGSNHIDSQYLKEIESKNKELEKEVVVLKKQLDLLTSKNEKDLNSQEGEVVLPEVVKVVEEKPSTPKVTVLKYQSLIDELQKLINDKIYMKKGSQGSRVGTIQKFLNLYNNTTKRVDNDYGLGTITDVIKFQKDQGITADGEVGPSTYTKMIDWLKTK